MTKPALQVRGSSRRIMSMWFRPANIRVINRSADSLDRHLYGCAIIGEEQRACALPGKKLLTRLAISELQFERKLNGPRSSDRI